MAASQAALNSPIANKAAPQRPATGTRAAIKSLGVELPRSASLPTSAAPQIITVIANSGCRTAPSAISARPSHKSRAVNSLSIVALLEIQHERGDRVADR